MGLEGCGECFPDEADMAAVLRGSHSGDALFEQPNIESNRWLSISVWSDCEFRLVSISVNDRRSNDSV